MKIKTLICELTPPIAGALVTLGILLHGCKRKAQNEIVLAINTNGIISLDGPTNAWKTNSEWDRISKAQHDHFTNPTNWVDIIQTNKLVFKEIGTRLKTLTNECYVLLLDGSILVRLSDEDWREITNCYRNRLQTNNIEIWCP